MGIADHIRNEVLGARLSKAGVLVVYDKDRRYRDLCLSLASDSTAVVDASESSIEAREAAARVFLSLIPDPSEPPQEPSPKELLVYIPAAPPLTDEDRQVDPFAAYAIAGVPAAAEQPGLTACSDSGFLAVRSDLGVRSGVGCPAVWSRGRPHAIFATMATARIIADPRIMEGKPVIEGTRITVELILTMLAEGCSVRDILEDYPHLTEAQVTAAIEYARRHLPHPAAAE